MVKKLVFVLPSKGDEVVTSSSSSLRSKNRRIHELLEECKEFISQCGTLSGWDASKRLTNEYEMVSSSSSAHMAASSSAALPQPSSPSRQPISRSYYKLWEILHDFESEMFGAFSSPMKVAFLAEGPGGFVESFASFGRRRTAGDQLHCITLTSNKRGVPKWKLDALRHHASQIVIHHGADGTGNLYKMDNIDHFVTALGGDGVCHLVTADGGFDFSADFNRQEVSSARLILCETYSALRLQRTNGSFVLKIFDVQCDETFSILCVLNECYRTVRLVKPLTSRPANSEKYVVCTGFVGCDEATMARIRQAIVEAVPFVCPVPSALLSALVHFNTIYVGRQIAAIVAAISHQERIRKRSNDKKRLDDGDIVAALRSIQVAKAVKWTTVYCRGPGG